MVNYFSRLAARTLLAGTMLTAPSAYAVGGTPHDPKDAGVTSSDAGAVSVDAGSPDASYSLDAGATDAGSSRDAGQNNKGPAGSTSAGLTPGPVLGPVNQQVITVIPPTPLGKVNLYDCKPGEKGIVITTANQSIETICPEQPKSCTSEFEGNGRCLTDVVADSLSLTDSKKGLCAGDKTVTCYDGSKVSSLKDKVSELDGNLDLTNNNLANLSSDYKSLENKIDTQGLSKLQRFALALDESKCGPEYDSLQGKITGAIRREEQLRSAEKKLNDYVTSNLSTETDTPSAQDPIDVLRYGITNGDTRINVKKARKLVASVQKAERRYAQATERIEDFVEDLKQKGCGYETNQWTLDIAELKEELAKPTVLVAAGPSFLWRKGETQPGVLARVHAYATRDVSIGLEGGYNGKILSGETQKRENPLSPGTWTETTQVGNMRGGMAGVGAIWHPDNHMLGAHVALLGSYQRTDGVEQVIGYNLSDTGRRLQGTTTEEFSPLSKTNWGVAGVLGLDARVNSYLTVAVDILALGEGDQGAYFSPGAAISVGLRK